MPDEFEHFGQVLPESRRGIFREPFWRQAFGAETKGRIFLAPSPSFSRTNAARPSCSRCRSETETACGCAARRTRRARVRSGRSYGSASELNRSELREQRGEIREFHSPFPLFPPVNFSLCSCQRFAPGKTGISLAAAQIQITPFGQHGDFAVGNRALQHPKTTIRTHIAHAIRSERFFRALDGAGD